MDKIITGTKIISITTLAAISISSQRSDRSGVWEVVVVFGEGLLEEEEEGGKVMENMPLIEEIGFLGSTELKASVTASFILSLIPMSIHSGSPRQKAKLIIIQTIAIVKPSVPLSTPSQSRMGWTCLSVHRSKPYSRTSTPAGATVQRQAVATATIITDSSDQYIPPPPVLIVDVDDPHVAGQDRKQWEHLKDELCKVPTSGAVPAVSVLIDKEGQLVDEVQRCLQEDDHQEEVAEEEVVDDVAVQQLLRLSLLLGLFRAAQGGVKEIGLKRKTTGNGGNRGREEEGQVEGVNEVEGDEGQPKLPLIAGHVGEVTR
ncbi:hypothetical protein TYRP_019543 [Tyrophagus putrescentiae]|nr:hypothetical protein TYRP_019543 [Tyrophagus putrescentiae]